MARVWLVKDRLKSLFSTQGWTLERGKSRLNIDKLVSPLRYDILVRQSFFQFLDTHEDLLRHERARFDRLAQDHEYFQWFLRIVCPAFFPQLVSDEGQLIRAYHRRVEMTLRLRSRFLASGFDSRFPILLAVGTNTLPTVTGKLVATVAHAGDGCHRLALLMQRGLRELSPEHYRLKIFDSHRPRDNTHKLLDLQSLDGPKYFEFISRGYGGAMCRTYSELLDQVQREHPSRVDELRLVLRIDGKEPTHSRGPR